MHRVFPFLLRPKREARAMKSGKEKTMEDPKFYRTDQANETYKMFISLLMILGKEGNHLTF